MTPEERARETAERIVSTFIRGRRPMETHGEMADAIASALLAEREAATRAEREACAQVAEEFAKNGIHSDKLRFSRGEVTTYFRGACRLVAEDIRARSEHTPTDAGGGEG